MEQETFTIEQLRYAFKFQKFIEANFPDAIKTYLLWPEQEKFPEAVLDYEQSR